ncbi:PST family polysaccharide transporter [Rhodococcus rhodochrous J38]|uniref:oligosaccharide flippase family protein n=1 Tax=Rhodococcus rhodochrous TaxID=1829 RepID=UPI00119DD040|nr:oligosaccharide flippase family protein [Rhodococcus rhodochrous]TWH42213.1 PST family polysaccharide transporter [Rhodococcus rhodochrous J38]
MSSTTPEETDPAGRPVETGPSGRSLMSSIGRVAGASTVALLFCELVSLAQTVALARLLTPAEIGIFVAGTVLTTFFGTFVEGGLRSGLIQRDTDVADAAETVFRVTLLAGIVMSIGALAAAPVIGAIFDSTTAGLVAAATSGVLLVYSVANVPEAMLQREFSVKRRLIVGPAVAVSYATVAVSTAALGWGVWSMVAGTYVSYITLVISVWAITSWRPGRGRASFVLWRELARYGAPLVLGMIGSRVQAATEAVVVGRGLSASDLGFFRYGQRIARIPAMAIIEIGSVALFPAFSRIAKDPDRLVSAYLRALQWATIGAAACSGLMIAAGTPAVVVVLGEPWRGAGPVVVALAGLSLGKAFICVSEEIIKGCGRTGLLNWYTLTEVGVGLVLLLVFVGLFGLVGAALSVSITAIVVGIVVMALAKRCIPVALSQLAGAILPPLPAAAIATVVLWLFEHHLAHSDTHPTLVAVALLALDALVFAAAYLLALGVFARSATTDLVGTVRRLVATAVRTRRDTRVDS